MPINLIKKVSELVNGKPPKPLSEFERIQKALRRDLKQSLEKNETIRFDYSLKDNLHIYNGQEIWYDMAVNRLEFLANIFKEQGMGDLQELYFRTVEQIDMYAKMHRWEPLPTDHLPKYDKTKCGVYTLKIDDMILPWSLCCNHFLDPRELARQGMYEVLKDLVYDTPVFGLFSEDKSTILDMVKKSLSEMITLRAA